MDNNFHQLKDDIMTKFGNKEETGYDIKHNTFITTNIDMIKGNSFNTIDKIFDKFLNYN